MHSAIEGHKLCCTLELPIELLKCWLPQTHPRPITWVPGAGPRHPRQLQPAWAPSSSNCAVGTSTGHLSWQPVGYSVVLSFGGFPGGSEVKASACNVGDLGSIPGLERSPGGGHGNPLQYSCLGNPHRERSSWGRKESDITEQLNTHINAVEWIDDFLLWP